MYLCKYDFVCVSVCVQVGGGWGAQLGEDGAQLRHAFVFNLATA